MNRADGRTESVKQVAVYFDTGFSLPERERWLDGSSNYRPIRGWSAVFLGLQPLSNKQNEQINK